MMCLGAIRECVSYCIITIIIITVLFFNCLLAFILQAAGKYRQQGRNYIVEDGDIIFFKFNAPNAPKKK